METHELISAVQALEPAAVPREKVDRAAVVAPVERFLELMARLRDEPDLRFDMLCTHTAIDWIAEARLELVYCLYSTVHRHYLVVSASVPREAAVMPSMQALWPIAEWQEREVYDLFGVRYTGHPDLRRILLDDDWQGFPLRKDYRDDFMLEGPK
ncbi:MAG: NADH-quinone oxidoreductase subunit C [Oligoflexia bacterium]|nr:NADH-quinone oxidoreductase subunit C [Oligoflexia bacterium]